MKTTIIIITIGLFLSACESELIPIDYDTYSALSTKIKVETVSLQYKESEIEITSSISGGNGQFINFVGHCWDYYERFASLQSPTIQDHSDMIVYSTILSGITDVNGDGLIDSNDITMDGNQIARNFSSMIPLYADSVCIARSFAIFNDSVIIYGYMEYIE